MAATGATLLNGGRGRLHGLNHKTHAGIVLVDCHWHKDQSCDFKRNKKQLEELQKYFEDLDQEKLEEETPVKTANHQPKARRGHAATTVPEIVPRELSTEELLEMYSSIQRRGV